MPTTTDPTVGPRALTDDELARLAQAGGQPSEAMRALYECLAAVMRGFVSGHVRRGLLPAAEAEDATQELALAFLEAVTRFDPGGSDGACEGRFRAFLRRVLRDALSKYERRLRRAECCLDRSKDAAGELDQRAAQGEQGPAARPPADPAALAAWEEDCRRLKEALERLGEEYRRLWDGLASGRSLEALAKEAGISGGQARRRRQRMVEGLRDAVGMAAPRPHWSGGPKPPQGAAP